jgi:glycosyltransferase involved in cell wall biosynthesis
MALAADRAPFLQMAIVGGSLFGLEQDYRAALEQLARDFDVADRIRFVGFRDDMDVVYASADIVLHTSVAPEPYGLVVAEGLAHGRAVIASDAGGVPEQIEHERNGLLVQPEDPGALADALVRMANEPGLRLQLGAAALEAPVTTPRSAAARLESLYERTLQGPA